MTVTFLFITKYSAQYLSGSSRSELDMIFYSNIILNPEFSFKIPKTKIFHLSLNSWIWNSIEGSIYLHYRYTARATRFFLLLFIISGSLYIAVLTLQLD